MTKLEHVGLILASIGVIIMLIADPVADYMWTLQRVYPAKITLTHDFLFLIGGIAALSGLAMLAYRCISQEFWAE